MKVDSDVRGRCSRIYIELSRVPRRDAMPAVRTVPLSNFR